METGLTTQQQNEWVIAKMQPKIKDIEFKDRKKAIAACLGEAMLLNGTSTNQEVFEAIAEALMQDFNTTPRYGHMTIAEFRIFMRKGMANEYGTYKNQMCVINYPNVMFWIKKGLDDTARTEALRKAEEEKFVAKKPSDEQIRAELIASCHNTYNGMKNGKVYLNLKPPFALYYDYLLERYGIEVERNGKVGKTLITDSNEKARVDKEAIEDFNSYIQAGFKKQSDITDFNTYADRMLHSQSRVNCIKKHHVIYLFKQLIEQGEEL